MAKGLLIIDDEPRIARSLQPFFEERGFRVTAAANAQAALEHLRDSSADVVLLDLVLPDCPGLELLSRLKRELPHLRVIVISALTDEQTIQEARERGASDYLTKPFDFDRCFYAAMGIETVDLSTVEPDAAAIARVPVRIAQQYRIVPLSVHEDTIELATDNPLDVRALDELRLLLGCEIRPVAVIAGDLADTIRRCYGVGAGVTQPGIRPEPSSDAAAAEPVDADGSTVAGLINELIERAYSDRASDLHLGVGAQGPWIQERIDGILYGVPVSPQLGSLYTSLISRFKVLANLDIAERRLPQDGRIWFAHGSTRLDLRISILPTLHGENLVLRLLEPSQILRLEQLGFHDDQLSQIHGILDKPTGLLLVSGPTGSGKSTSLYAFLSKLNTGKHHIITIEDPIEHELQGLTQIQVQPKIGLTFATGLRSILRHDPDIIMVGEIRDEETANLAIRAALTGHLVLATIHTNDASSAITRLMDLGIEPFLLCSTLSGILSQRLIRLLCQQCRQQTKIDGAALGAMGLNIPAEAASAKLWGSQGCTQCRMTGYQGRTGVFELLVVDHRIRSLMIKRTPAVQIRQSAMAQGMRSLWQSGWQKIQAGHTSLEELIRVLPPSLQ